MIENPDQYIEAFCDAGADLFPCRRSLCPFASYHSTHPLSRAMTGVVINPATPVSAIEPILAES